jgi:gentisate 1,2-dioxygenase
MGVGKFKVEDNEFDINSKDTFSLPLNTKVSISIDNNEECFLNCVSKA